MRKCTYEAWSDGQWVKIATQIEVPRRRNAVARAMRKLARTEPA